MPSTGITALKPRSYGELEQYLLTHKPGVDEFRLRGPFEVTTRADHSVALAGSLRVSGDLYLSAAPGKAPLVILLHGYDNSKDDHAYQAMHLATWGMHTFAVDLPNHGPWVRNGRTLASLVDAIQKRPELLDSRVDPRRIVLAGHSFGAFSVVVALSDGAPVAGGVLLDPASAGSKVLPGYLRKVDKPVMVIGADEHVSAARDRSDFYRHVRTGVAEVSVHGAAHEDAQFALETGTVSFSGDVPTEEHQVTFVSALTAAAFSLAAGGGLDYAWTSLSDAIRSGRFTDPRKK